MNNVLLAIQLLTALAEQIQQVSKLIGAAQASGTDISADQLAQLTDSYTAAVQQLNSDIAAAKAAGK